MALEFPLSLRRASTTIWKAQRKARAGTCKISEVVFEDSKITRAEAEVAGNFKDARNAFLNHTSVVYLIWRPHILFLYFAGITKQLFPNTDDALIRRMMGQKLNNCTKKPILSKDLNSGAFQKHSFW